MYTIACRWSQRNLCYINFVADITATIFFLFFFFPALIKLKRPAILNSRVSLVCLPSQGYVIPDGRKCYATGKSIKLLIAKCKYC